MGASKTPCKGQAECQPSVAARNTAAVKNDKKPTKGTFNMKNTKDSSNIKKTIAVMALLSASVTFSVQFKAQATGSASSFPSF
jgi:hypothetical protein